MVGNFLFAQGAYEYLGVLRLSDTTLISYKIVFTETDGAITGHSITDLGGPHETKSNISGTFNLGERSFAFREEGIVYTKSPIGEVDFCFVHFNGRLKKLNTTQQIEGAFKGLYGEGEQCIGGEMLLGSLSKILGRATKLDKKIAKNVLVKKETKQRINLRKTLDTLNMNLINKGETLHVFSKDKSIQLVVYDAGKEDGDRINLTVNGQLKLENHTVMKDKETIFIPLTAEQTVIEVVALNVGTSAPNTVRIELKDSKNLIRTLTNLSEGEKAGVTILKQ
ncbi:MAG: hypothetical protein ACPGU0_01830 [Marinirhabdus sp.]